MKFLALTAALLLWYSVAGAQGYGSYDLKRILNVSETPTGKEYRMDVNYLDQILDDLAAHAGNYPPRFDSVEDRNRAERDVGGLSAMLLGVLDPATGENPQPEILLRAARVNSIGYNLDIEGSAEKAASLFQRLLTILPSHPRGNYYYGNFLASAAKLAESVPYLEKALAAGFTGAGYALGLVHVSLGNTGKALEYLEDFRTRVGGDKNVSMLIEAIRSGNVKTRVWGPEVTAPEQSYTNPVYRWSIRYPADWTIDSQNPDLVRIHSASGNGLCGILSSFLTPGGSVQFSTVDELTDFLLATNKRFLQEKQLALVILARRRISLGNDILGNDVLVEIRPGWKSRRIDILGGRGFVQIDCETRIQHWEKLEPFYDRIIRSFGLTK